MKSLFKTLQTLLFVVLAGCGGSDATWQPQGRVDYAVLDGQVAGATIEGATEHAVWSVSPDMPEAAADSARGLTRVDLFSRTSSGDAATLSLYWRGRDWDTSGEVVYFSSRVHRASFDDVGGADFVNLAEGQTLQKVPAATLFAEETSGPAQDVDRFFHVADHVVLRFIDCAKCGGGEGRTIVEATAFGQGVFGTERAATASFVLAPKSRVMNERVARR